jgi:hypothetical protein
MTNKIWYEMVDMKYGEMYLSNYIGLQHRLKKIFKIMTLILSVSGIFGWKYFETFAWVAFVLIAFMQLLTLIENQLIRSDKEVEEISLLKIRYSKYFNKLERLWIEYQNGTTSDKKALDIFFKLKDSDWIAIEEIAAKINIKKFKRLMNKADIETIDYINKFHKNE